MRSITILLQRARYGARALAAAVALLAPFTCAAGDLRAVLRQAIESADGTARTVLDGPDSAALRQGFGGAAALAVDVSTLKVYAQPGCRRLNLAFRVETPGPGSKSPHRVDLGLNYCRDGSPPASLREVRP